MLVLSRQIQESVAVGNADGHEPMLKVTVLAIRGGTVKLGFEGDKGVPVHRWEVWERVQSNGDARADSRTEAPATACSVFSD